MTRQGLGARGPEGEDARSGGLESPAAPTAAHANDENLHPLQSSEEDDGGGLQTLGDNDRRSNNQSPPAGLGPINENQLDVDAEPRTDEVVCPPHGGGNGIRAFTVGMFLDVLDTVNKWCEAEVLAVNQEARTIYITYTYWGNAYDEALSFDSHRVAPFETHTYRGNPAELKLHQRIEVLDERGTWREAEPIDFSTDGTRVLVHYRGFQSSFDAWVPRTTERILPYGREKENVKAKNRARLQRSSHNVLTVKSDNRHHRHQASLPSPNADHTRQIEVTSDRYTQYRDALARQRLMIVPIEGDGNCLFRSVSHQIYGSDEYHRLVRLKCMEYMEVERRYFEPYVVGDMDDFLRYLQAKRLDGVWGDDPEVQALCEMYDRPAEIWAFDLVHGARKLRTFHEASGFTARADRAPMMLSYYGGGHYDSITHLDSRGLVDEPPGVVEDRAIEMARQRISAESQRGLYEMKRRSDEEATEEAAVEAALKASREEFDTFTDLQTALEMSAQAEIQAELLKHAAEQSEEELVKQAIADSMKMQGVSVEDELLQRAMKESMGVHQGDGGMLIEDHAAVDPDMEAALKLSMEHYDEYDRQLKEALKVSQAEAGDFAEDDLAAALALSLEHERSRR